MNTLPPYVTRELVLQRLPLIFPSGTPNRNYCIRELAASTVFTMLYIGAVESMGIYAAPVHVYRMTEEQASLSDDNDRSDYQTNSLKRGYHPIGRRWYADNTREPIRDETLREGLVQIGAVESLSGISTTSSKPRYFLKKDFAALFDPELVEEELTEAVASWQTNNLSKSALTRLSLAGLGAGNDNESVLVTFPNKETRKLTSGLSAEISRAVIEVFAVRFLERPVVLWLSTSDDKVVARDDRLASSIGLNIEADRNLPDIILVDLAPEHPLLVFIEVVATDGAITERRQNAIYELTDTAGFSRNQVAFVTAYLDRQSPGFLKTVRSLAWNSLVWFVSEPEKLLVGIEDAPHLTKLNMLWNKLL